MQKSGTESLKESVARLSKSFLSPMDLLPHSDFREKCIDLVLNGTPDNVDQKTAIHFHDLRQHLIESGVDNARVVVFGGGSGLSTIIGGDSRQSGWTREPFAGLKEIFPNSRSIVCVTDDGGSTGELIKDLPVIALGDIRHVLLSSIQLRLLQRKYGLTFRDAQKVVEGVSSIFNYRFEENEISPEKIAEIHSLYNHLFPIELKEYIFRLVKRLFEDDRLIKTLSRAHCLGNLLLTASIYSHIHPDLDNADLESDSRIVGKAIFSGLQEFAYLIGAADHAVLPCTTTPAQLRFCYTNGVHVTGESKSGTADRRFPVDKVIVDFSGPINVHDQIFKSIEAADIIILAPGSLYSSIIPIFQVPDIAEAVRNNTHAFKMLISNLWVQAGETDIAISDPDRKFHVSDMIRAYESNIPGGTKNLFNEILCLSLKDVPASILQNYALEGKIPIYLDKNIVSRQGFIPLECGIYSKKDLTERGVIKHDPELLAQAVKTIYISYGLIEKTENSFTPEPLEKDDKEEFADYSEITCCPSNKYSELTDIIGKLPIIFEFDDNQGQFTETTRRRIVDIIWKHQDIPLSHLEFAEAIVSVNKEKWRREQIWDKVFSFYDPEDSSIKIRSDQFSDQRKLETAILIALGQSLLGNYAEMKSLEEIIIDDTLAGKIFHLYIHKPEEINCFFTMKELVRYLELARMNKPISTTRHYTRLVNGNEGFTPPGVLMGLTYAWYLDNRLASHIEYKMALMKIGESDLIPEQLKMLARRNSLIHFFREKVFCK